MKKSLADTAIQLGTLIVAGMTMLGAFFAWIDSRYAHADLVNEQAESQRELKAEVDAIYEHWIPNTEQRPLKHKQDMGH